VRQAITPAMKVLCLLHRAEVTCAICGEPVLPEDDIEWDHIWALTHGGPHTYSNLRPLHFACHKVKTKADIQARAKVRRITGETKGRVSKPLRSRGFDKTKSRKFNGTVVPRPTATGGER